MPSPRKPLAERKTKPTYSIAVRLGLETIARRTRPIDMFEAAAIEWIVNMHRWHKTRIAPQMHARYLRGKAAGYYRNKRRKVA